MGKACRSCLNVRPLWDFPGGGFFCRECLGKEIQDSLIPPMNATRETPTCYSSDTSSST